MEGMNDGHMPGMNGSTTTTTTPPPHHHKMMMMHMTFFWGTHSEILFSSWPGTRTGMYALALVFVFALCVLVEWLSHCRFPAKPGVASRLLRSLLHALRMGLAYLAMLALMSFNGGVFLAAVAGHAVGFLAFANRGAFGKPEEAGGPGPYAGKASAALPPMSC
ncbi:copper transporter 2-like [Rhodamnia argentea]|uniref:Copper transport protein n=1 Tax=Rhodamnia argentea TaxID=178133 RepID=A0A8B8NQD4_9MYRT|nr:copper transporter 2-like [Rhodamnia argentea]